MKCPKCRANTLDPFGVVEGVHVDFCSSCKGIWFDEGELAFYTEMPMDIPKLEAALSNGRDTGLECPKCSPPFSLIEVNYVQGQHPLLDLCPRCKGIFVDRGEMPQIERLTTKIRGAEVIGVVAKQLEAKGYQILGVEKGSKTP